MVFESREILAPYFAGTEMAIVEFVGEGEVDAFDVWRKNSGAGA